MPKVNETQLRAPQPWLHKQTYHFCTIKTTQQEKKHSQKRSRINRPGAEGRSNVYSHRLRHTHLSSVAAFQLTRLIPDPLKPFHLISTHFLKKAALAFNAFSSSCGQIECKALTNKHFFSSCVPPSLWVSGRAFVCVCVCVWFCLPDIVGCLLVSYARTDHGVLVVAPNPAVRRGNAMSSPPPVMRAE